MLEEIRLQRLSRRGITGLILFCILAYLLVFGILNFSGLPDLCNSDVYADMQYARRAWEQKSLFPQGWTFGNQLYIFASPVLAALFYGLTGSINMAMALATETMTLLILLSFFWMSGSFTKDRMVQLLLCLLLLASPMAPYGPYSIHSMLFFTQASFYACYLITAFLVFGDYLRVKKENKSRKISWAISLFLCFATGMQSLRQTAVMVLPILLWEVLEMFCRLVRRKRLWSPVYSGRTLRALSYAAANFTGILVSHFLNIPQAAIYGQTTLVPPEQWPERLQAVLQALLEITSLDYLLAGDYSRLLCGVIWFFITITIIAVGVMISRRKGSISGLEISWLLCWISIAGTALSTVLLSITLRGIYLFMWFPLVAISGAIILEKLPALPKMAAVTLACLLSLASLLYCYVPHVSAVFQGDPTDAEQLCQWAASEGYAYVYGDYWGTAPQIAVYSDGTLEAGCWHTSENVFQVELSNTPQDIYGTEENEKAIYVFTPEDEASGLRKAREQGVSLTKQSQFGIYSVYTSPVPLMHSF